VYDCLGLEPTTNCIMHMANHEVAVY